MDDDGDPGPGRHSGDTGRVFFGGHGRVPKTDPRVAAYTEIDAANAALGVAMAGAPFPREVTTMLLSAQNDLLDIVTELGVSTYGESVETPVVAAYVERLDRAIDHFERLAGDLGGMVLPGGTLGAALLYQARAAVRRAELAVWRAVEADPDTVDQEVGRYLNRLSTLVFVLARGANIDHGDVAWVPGSSVAGTTPSVAGDLDDAG